MTTKRSLPPLARAAIAIALASLGWSHTVAAHDGPHEGHGGGAKIEFPVSCTAAAQAAFNDAVTLLHHMTYPQARQGFEHVLELDPKCAMAHWGVAMTLFQPLWPTRPGPEALQSGSDHVQKALALAPVGRERAFIEAAQAFYLDPSGTDYWLRIRRWEAASAAAYAAFPDDAEIAAFYALAHLATTPSNAISRKNADESAAILLKVYRDKPGHPGAMHYLVHANDVPGRERELLQITREYEAAAPNNPHALHMPTHIYTRLGEWDSVIRGNLRAADAALLYPAGEKGELVWDEFPHAIEYLVYAYLQKGDEAHALAQLQRLHGTKALQPSFKTAFHLASTQARYALERKDWRQAAALVPGEPKVVDWGRFPWAEAVVQFAHGLGSVRTGKLDAGTAAATRLATLEAATRKAGEDLFARNIQVLRLELEGWIAQAGGDPALALARLTEAAALEAATPKHAVTPAPTLPAQEQLGDLLMEQKKPGPALTAYRQSLLAYPNRLNSLLGVARASAPPQVEEFFGRLREDTGHAWLEDSSADWLAAQPTEIRVLVAERAMRDADSTVRLIAPMQYYVMGMDARGDEAIAELTLRGDEVGAFSWSWLHDRDATLFKRRLAAIRLVILSRYGEFTPEQRARAERMLCDDGSPCDLRAEAEALKH